MKINVSQYIDLLESLKETPSFLYVALDHNDKITVLTRKDTSEANINVSKEKISTSIHTILRLNIDGSVNACTTVSNTQLSYDKAHYLPDGNILMISSRVELHDDGTFEKNANIYDQSGNFLRHFLIGDGIIHSTLDCEGAIWTGYSDEGIYGSNGWNNPVGMSGLIHWNKYGNKIWEYSPPEDLNFISDCYALTMDNKGSIWCSYYTDFPLIRIDKNKKINHWNLPIMGCQHLCVKDNFVLLDTGYTTSDCTLLVFDKECLQTIAQIDFYSPEGQHLNHHMLSSSGSFITFLHDFKIYIIHWDSLILKVLS